MAELILIIDQPEVVWMPPKFGEVSITVEQYTSVDSLVHLCCRNTNLFTTQGYQRIPAVYTFLKNGIHLVDSPKVTVEVKGPVEFYFLDSNLNRMTKTTPSVRLVIRFE